MIAQSPLPIPPSHCKSVAASIGWLAFLILGFSAIAAPAQTERSSAYRHYRDYLNYHRARIDGELHPNTENRAAAADHAAKLKPSTEKQNVEAIRKELQSNSSERNLTLTGLRAMSADLAASLLQSESKLLDLAKLRDDESVPAEKKPSEAEITQLEGKIAWLTARAEFYDNETIALAGKPTADQRAGELYAAFIRLAEARQLAEFSPDAERKRLAEASFELQSQRLRGKTIDAARKQLPPRQLAAAARELGSKLKPIPNRLRALAKRHPDESNRLRALQQFYQAELELLRELR